MIGSIQLFDMVWVLTGGGPANATTTMATYLINQGTQRHNYGIAGAASVILFVIGFVMALLYQVLVLRRTPRGPVRSDDMTATREAAFGGGGPLVYGSRWSVVASRSARSLYGALGGFRSNEQLARDPAGLPDPWVFSNYTRRADQRGVLALRAELHRDRG